MTSPTSNPAGPEFLFDACTLINLSYCEPIAALFRERCEDRAGWVKVVHTELVGERTRLPPNPQAGKTLSWASTWLGSPLEVKGQALLDAVEDTRQQLLAGLPERSQFDHLGEATSIVLLGDRGSGRFLTDDHGARSEARRQGIRATSSIGILSALIRLKEQHQALTEAAVDDYLDTLRAKGRMHGNLTYLDLARGDLGSWG